MQWKQKRCLVFEDIPYAQPPIGNLRWKAPKEISKQNEILPAENILFIQRPSNLGGVEGKIFMLVQKMFIFRYICTKKNFRKELPVICFGFMVVEILQD